MAAPRMNMKIVRNVEPPEQRVFLKGLPVSFLECRDINHPWETVDWYIENGQRRRANQCTRCDTQRIDTWLGNKWRYRYIYPDGFQAREMHLQKVDFRLELFSRVTWTPR